MMNVCLYQLLWLRSFSRRRLVALLLMMLTLREPVVFGKESGSSADVSAYGTQCGAYYETGTFNIISNTTGLMVLVPGGANSGTDPDSGMPYSLTVNSFYMDPTEVTLGLWDVVRQWGTMNRGYSIMGGGAHDANHPVHSVDYFNVMRWCNARSEMDGLTPVYFMDPGFTDVYRAGSIYPFMNTSANGYRLPTSREWMYAARGGVASRRFPWDDVDTIQHARANYNSSPDLAYDTSPTRGFHPNAVSGTARTVLPASFAPNPFGLYDMAGNLAEMTYEYTSPGAPGGRRLCGGSWSQNASFCRISYGIPFMAPNRETGFRTIRSPSARMLSPLRSGHLVEGDRLRFAADGALGDYLWDFGDGRASFLKAPGLVAFPQAGEFEVSLKFRSHQTEAYADVETRTLMVVENTGVIPDLVVEALWLPHGVAVSGPTMVAYSVRNTGDGPVTGATWTDAVYLSRNGVLDSSATRLGQVPVSHALAAGEVYHGSMPVVLPPVIRESLFSLIVSVDTEWDLLDRRRLNNERAMDITIPLLEQGVGQAAPHPFDRFSHYYRIHVPAGGKGILVTLSTDIGIHHGLRLLASHGRLPSLGQSDFSTFLENSLFIPPAASGDWFILVSGRAIPIDGEYTITYELAEQRITSVSPKAHALPVPFTINLYGIGFRSPMGVELYNEGGLSIPAELVEVDSVSRITAHFDDATIVPGMYSVRASGHGMESDLADAFEVVAPGGAPRLVSNLIVPNNVGVNAPATLYVEYVNTGDIAMPAPLLVVGPDELTGANQPLLSLDSTRVGAGAWADGVPEGFSHTVQFLAGGELPGMLQPGESRRVPIYYVGLDGHDGSAGTLRFRLGSMTVDDTTAMDWDSLKAGMRPNYIREDAWDALWTGFTNLTGATVGEYVAMLGRQAAYLERQGQHVQDAVLLLAFALRQADGLNPLPTLASATDAVIQAPGMPIVFQRSHLQPISRRFEVGAFGRGWAHNWHYRTEARPNGAVSIIGPSGTPRIFQPDRRPNRPFLAAPGDHGELRATPGGGYTLTEADGNVRAFHADGALDYVEDTNANRITCVHSGGRLTALQHSSGQSLAIAWDDDDRIVSLEDHLGRRTEYVYVGEHLVSVQAYDGRITAYAWNDTPGSPAQHALTSMTRPDGVTRTFEYDASGRLAVMAREGEHERITFTYGNEGGVSVSDALGHTTRYAFDYAGRMIRRENPLGSAVRYAFNALGQVASITDPAGLDSTFEYDTRGNLSAVSDAMRRTTRFTYSRTFNRLASVTDANGTRMEFASDNRGNPVEILYVDESRETWTYDAHGNPTAWVNRRGDTIAYTHDDDGRITGKTLPGGREAVYTYDARGNLLSAADPGGTNTFTYSEADYLLRVDYPGERWLAFTYDAAGRRTSSLDQTGRRLDYHYDDAGRLARMTDETAVEIVRHEFDTLGRLTRKTVGNGVYTDYAYDAAGQVASLVNRGPDDAELSRFDYTYDLRGRRIAMASHYGNWTYDYDDAGQLVHAVLASTAGDIPSQDLRYTYDAVGNRLSATVNGVEAEYSPNELNQYAQVGDRTYTYDLDGNLIEESGPDGVTVYTYNEENRLVGVTRGADSWTYVYDALGNRVASSDNGVVTHYLVDPAGLGNVVGEYDADGTLLARYDHAIGLINRTDGVGTAYYTFDALGNVSELVGAAGTVHNAYAYRPFGETLRYHVSVPNPFEFVGQWGVMAEPYGLNYMRARFYDPGLGRFMAMDPIGLAGRDVNFYRYANNTPLLLIDPSGEVAPVFIAALWIIKKALIAATPYVVKYWPIAKATISALLTAYDISAGIKIVDAPYYQGREDEVCYLDWMEYWSVYGRLPDNVFFDPPKYSIMPIDDGFSNINTAIDPNEKTGPAGYGEQNFVSIDRSLAYRIDFENLESATAPAQVVTISDPLDAAFDWSTFALTEIGFGDELITVPAGKGQYFETIMPYQFDGVAFEVHIEAGVHTDSGQAFANFYTIDPATGWPPPVEVGFLPPEDGTGRGMGHVSYVIRAEPDLPTGTEIRNIATIQFDFGLKIDTNQVDPLDPDKGTDPELEAAITLDSLAPTSAVAALPVTVYTGDVLVSWTGEDDVGGSGIAAYEIYARIDDGPWQLWTNTPALSATYGSRFNATYAFYSVAMDYAGNREAKTQQAEAHTLVNMPTIATPQFDPGAGDYPGHSVTVTVTCATSDAHIYYTLDGSDPDESGASVLSGASIELSFPATLAAKAFKAGMNPSAVARMHYDGMTASGIPFSWLRRHGLPTDGSFDHLRTPGSFHTVWQHWRADTDPNDPSDALRLLGPPESVPLGYLLRWRSVTTRTYTVESSTNLWGSPAFAPFEGSSGIQGEDGTTEFVDETPVGTGPLFYRVLVE